MGARGDAKRAEPPKAEALDVALATLVDQAPVGDEWLHEIKLDGYRIVARIAQGKVQLLSRRHHDWTAKAPTIARALEALPVHNAVLDGELCSVRKDGVTDFQALQNAMSESGAASLKYFAFDLLFLNGEDLRAESLLDRKAALAGLLGRAKPSALLRLSDHVVGDGPRFFAQACKLGLEGIISKRATAPYRATRGHDWLKIKCISRQEFVIGGFTPPAGARTHFGALLIGVREGTKLRYAGKVGTGFSGRTLASLHAKLTPLQRDTAPFANPPRGAPVKGARWVEPVLVAEIAFTEFTKDGHLRHPSFVGLREDKAAKDVVRETPEKTGKKKAAKRRT
ncbi:MAG: non-homologous end-joining DNA ligase [Polyangiales bacterium]